MPRRLGRLGDGDCREYRCETLGDRVIATMPVYLAMRTFFFDVGDFSTRRQFAIAADHASTRESSKPKESNEAHEVSSDSKSKQSMYRDGRARETSIFSTRPAKTSRDLNTGAAWTEHGVCRHGAHTRVGATALGSHSNDWTGAQTTLVRRRQFGGCEGAVSQIRDRVGHGGLKGMPDDYDFAVECPDLMAR